MCCSLASFRLPMDTKPSCLFPRFMWKILCSCSRISQICSQTGVKCFLNLFKNNYFNHYIQIVRTPELTPTKHGIHLLSYLTQGLFIICVFLKFRLYNISVMSVLLKTWSIVQADKKRLDAFDSRCSGRMCNIKWQYFVRKRHILRGY